VRTLRRGGIQMVDIKANESEMGSTESDLEVIAHQQATIHRLERELAEAKTKALELAWANTEAQDALAAAARDAERYRYLRNEVGHGKDQPHAVIDDDFGAGWLTEERLDEAIDAARAGKVS
jgi:hypothetical protein